MSNILIPRNLEGRTEQRKQIDLKRIQEYIKKGSEGDLFLEGTPLTKLPDDLVVVGGDLDLSFSNIEDLNNLEYVGKNLWAANSKLKLLPPKLTRIPGILSLAGCPVDNIDGLNHTGGSLLIERTNINELPKGLEIGGCKIVLDTPLEKRFPYTSAFKEYLKERNIIVKGDVIF